MLRRGLRRAAIATREVNIWEDPEAAATVRRLAGGNETVPTVVIGDTALVNPSVRTVRAALAEASPERAPVRRFGLPRRRAGRDAAAEPRR